MGIRVIDLKKDLLEKVDNPKKLYPLGIMGHLNEYGYKLSAENINNFILSIKD